MSFILVTAEQTYRRFIAWTAVCMGVPGCATVVWLKWHKLCDCMVWVYAALEWQQFCIRRWSQSPQEHKAKAETDDEKQLEKVLLVKSRHGQQIVMV